MFFIRSSSKNRLPSSHPYRWSFSFPIQSQVSILLVVLAATTLWAAAALGDEPHAAIVAPGGWDPTQPRTAAPVPEALKGATDLNLVVTEILPYQLGCERPDDDQTRCDSGCSKADELGYIRDPAANLAYNPSAFSLGSGRYAVLVQTGCSGDFLESYTLDLNQESVALSGQVRDGSQFLCPEDPPNRPPRPEVLGGPDILPLAGCSRANDQYISFFSFGNADIYRGRVAWGYSADGSDWTIRKEPFLFFPLCVGRNGICDQLGVSTVAALDFGNYYYLYLNLFNSGPQGIILIRVEKSCTAPYVVLGAGGAQVFNKKTRDWEELAFDPADGYRLETCPSDPTEFEPYLLIPSGSSLGVAYSSADGYLLTHKQRTGQLRYLRADEPTFDGGDAPAYTIDASLLSDYYRYELCPGGQAPIDPDDPCVYDWDIRNHHIELQEEPVSGGYLMFFTRMNRRDSNKFRFSSVRVARVERAPGAPPLLSPSGVSATDGAELYRVAVSWNEVDGATEYEIWRNTVQKPRSGVRIATVPQTSIYYDDTVVGGTVYHYWVRAKNSWTTSGYSPSDTGYASLLTCQQGRIEAESGLLLGRFEQRSEGSTGYILVPDTANGSALPVDDSQSASYCVTVPATGTYRIQGRVRAPNHGADSFYVRVDEEPEYLWVPRPLGNWVVDEVNDTRGASVIDPVELELTAGDHVIKILLREDGTELDYFELVETSTQPPCGGLSQQAEHGLLSDVFEVRTDGSRTYIVVPEDGDFGGAVAPDDRWKASYCVTVPSTGTYRILGQVRAPSHGADSFYVRVDGQAEKLWVTSPLQNWVSDEVNDTRGSNIIDPVDFSLAAGIT